MAIVQVIQKSGLSLTVYKKVVAVNIAKIHNAAIITIQQYADREHAANPANCIGSETVAMPIETACCPDPFAAAYVFIKTLPDLAGSTDV